ncbi:glycosyltransferase family 4 protein [Georgenia sp. AZ-5]|uniref:glycosyltransferase family 4 protein n=1 Tax=Georgenia sp. AZ-5 TaxID=3367526 RepID=UPI003754CFC1
MLTLVKGGMGGTETYARALTREIREDTLNARCFLPRTAAGFSEGMSEVVVPQVSAGPSTAQRLGAVASATLRRGPIVRALSGADVIHLPFTAEVPRLPRRAAMVTTVHDLQHRDLPELFGRAEKAYRYVMYERPARRADAVITISEFAKSSIERHLGIPPERIHVVSLGVDTSEFVPHLGERENFILYPARGWAHKNHRTLIDAVEVLRRDDPALRLVLTGGGLETLGDVPDWVEVRGLVHVAELRDLYRRARMLVFPSRYEGFGLPPLEAMASGCPVAASDAGSIPEVCGDAAVLFDPDSVEAIVAAVRETTERSVSLQKAGLEQVRRFTWEACARSHEDIYLALADRQGRR